MMSGYARSLTWGSTSARGSRHSRNEDSLISALPVFAVADGLGGHMGGAAASQIAISAFACLCGKTCSTQDVLAAVETANRLIHASARHQPSLLGMCTTFTGLVLVEHDQRELWLVLSIGDSRAYHLVNGQLALLTVDHTIVQELVEVGALTPEQAVTDRRRNVVTRALGGASSPEVDFSLVAPRPGERFLICSDGLTGAVEDERIAEALSDAVDPADAASDLVEEAVRRGATDDVTALVVFSKGSDQLRMDDVPTRRQRRTPLDVTAPVPMPGGWRGDDA